jgi:hypothetical protein
MRKLITGLSFAAVAAVALASPSFAQEPQYTTGYATAVGVGLYNGWYGTSSAITTGVATTTAGAITFGGVAGVGTVALIDGAFQPCRGFHAMFGANKESCANGEFVGNAPRRMR